MKNIFDQLTRDEGIRLKPYKDSLGKTTIGIGRNLDSVGISNDEANYLLHNDVAKADSDLKKYLPWTIQFETVEPIRYAVLLNMTFNMGIGKVVLFHDFLQYMQQGNWNEAKCEMLRSMWAKQVGFRADRLAIQVITDEWQ